MTYKADDLTPLLAGASRADVGFHQGKVITWNEGTAENSIAMAGAVLTNVPILNGNEVLVLAPGHIVGMLRFKSSYFILGRIVIPNQSDAGALPGLMQGVGTTESDFEITTDRLPKAQAVFTVPSWANQALVMCNANASVTNGSGSAEFVYVTATISNGFGGEMYEQVANGGYGQMGASTQYLIGSGSYNEILGGEIPLGPVITVASKMRASATIPASPFNITSVHATAMFRKV